jgi:hypothetical protein
MTRCRFAADGQGGSLDAARPHSAPMCWLAADTGGRVTDAARQHRMPTCTQPWKTEMDQMQFVTWDYRHLDAPFREGQRCLLADETVCCGGLLSVFANIQAMSAHVAAVRRSAGAADGYSTKCAAACRSQ